jgi:phosphatidylglycerophosphate synthase
LVSHDYFWSSIFAFIAMIGSIMVSYTRARAEGLGVTASVGIMQRPERILLIGVSAVLCGVLSPLFEEGFKIQPDGFPIPIFEAITIFTFPIFILAILSNITALRRLKFSKNYRGDMRPG